jgi:hypothetical protein
LEPHCTTSWSSQAFWIFAPARVAPIASIVVILEAPTLSIEVTHERVAAPSICTVHAPQSAIPQPNFVLVMPSTSRNTQRSGVSPSTSTVRSTPLTLIVMAIVVSVLFGWAVQQNRLPYALPTPTQAPAIRAVPFVSVAAHSLPPPA